ncbi:carboxymuconolactone decarboxylase family protein [Aneurinibacillus sp. Ricciae_BoGa-3]|uniref:carboxymuconolactone decarboxylase family protein n=1 Tax=Aneurinibacillus sp. Ricciae_BoGa-3 TaxID=3022697 RepID=UPI00233FC89A|nr:carboxymuconolactone decarboxylase family protein [Aneurinibacillus sp. Ricciae_BoGa-3]WCK55042.1 carboxymuconolactone decarboxylase family protein [Aneurinibacillus sp. Ricciae_BoGa-3]
MSNSKELTPAQKMIGDVAPKLVQLNDDVLFGDVWDLSEEELIEVITHLAFYAGWTKAMSAIMVAKEVFKK